MSTVRGRIALPRTVIDFTLASQSEAEAGSDNTKVMTPLRVRQAIDAFNASVTAHLADTNNPHAVTKAQVGLGNVDNTSDLAKPISTLTQSALDLKASALTVAAHIADTANPHAVTKTQVGLGNVDNTSDANKPLSTAATAALALKADKDGGTIGGTTKSAAIYSARFGTDAASGQTQINYSSGADSLSKSVLWLRDRVFGTVTGAEASAPARIAPHKIIFTDNAHDSTSVGVNALHILHVASGNGSVTGSEGTRETLQTRLQVSGQYGTTGYIAFTPYQSIAYASANQAGVTGWNNTLDPDSYYRGGMFGGALSTWLASGATYFRGITGLEINWGVLSGASTFSKIGLALVKTDDDVGAGTVDAGIAISQKDTAGAGAPIGIGIMFGNPTGHWAFDATSTLIGSKKRGEGLSAVGSPEASIAANYGVDLSGVTFTTAAFRSSGFAVLPAGGVRTDATTVGALPSAATVGAGTRMYVTDANSTTFNATAVGGGSNKVPVVSDGTNWKIG